MKETPGLRAWNLGHFPGGWGGSVYSAQVDGAPAASWAPGQAVGDKLPSNGGGDECQAWFSGACAVSEGGMQLRLGPRLAKAA